MTCSNDPGLCVSLRYRSLPHITEAAIYLWAKTAHRQGYFTMFFTLMSNDVTACLRYTSCFVWTVGRSHYHRHGVYVMYVYLCLCDVYLETHLTLTSLRNLLRVCKFKIQLTLTSLRRYLLRKRELEVNLSAIPSERRRNCRTCVNRV